MTPTLKILQGDCRDTLRTLPDESVSCVVTSPPYWGLRDYGCSGQIGLEQSLDEFLAQLVGVFREVRRVLKRDGTCWVNMGDSYSGSWGAQGRQGATGQMATRSVVSARQIASAQKRSSGTGSLSRTPGLKGKELIGQPWRLAFALQSDGWWLRQDIIWHKPNPMPESVRDRCTKAHEYLFLLTKAERYFWDQAAMSEPALAPEGNGNKDNKGAIAYRNGDHRHRTKNGLADIGPRETRNRRSVWTIPTEPYSEAHFATYPQSLVRPCILAGCPVGGTVLDPFGGSGTTGQVALELGRNAILCELNPDYVELIRRRCAVTPGLALS